jgi:hypothetical protein
MTSLCAFALIPVFAGTIATATAQVQQDSHPKLAHTREEFSFVVNAPYDETFPLFGAYEERKWAVGFDPRFVFPSSPHDQQGMVFTTVQEGLLRVWTNTCFDFATGHVQYVYWIADVMVAFIDIRVTNFAARQTQIKVVYERTALRAEANRQVLAMAQADANNGPHWAGMINGYLQKTAAK